MADLLKIELLNKEKLQRQFDRIQSKSKDRAIRIVNSSAMRIRNSAIKKVPVDTGRLKTSIQVKFFNNGQIAHVGSWLSYAAFVEFGTGRAGKATSPYKIPEYQHGEGHGWPPAGPLTRWVIRNRGKLGGPKRKPKRGTSARMAYGMWVRQMVYLIQAAIYQRGGLKARPFLFPAYEAERPVFIRRLTAAMKDLSK